MLKGKVFKVDVSKAADGTVWYSIWFSLNDGSGYPYRMNRRTKMEVGDEFKINIVPDRFLKPVIRYDYSGDVE